MSEDRYRRALEKLVAHLDSCPQYESGAGGMTIEAQVARSFLRGVRAIWVEEARDVLYGLDEYKED